MNISTQNLIDLDGSVQLKPGQRMVRVSGSTWMPVGVGGNFMPGASQSVSTSDATATAGDIKLGKTAYVADGKVTGTLAKAEVAYNSAMYQYYAVADGYVDAGDMVLDFSQATYGDAGADSLLQGATAWVNGQQITGTIPVVSASVSGNTVTVPYGYHQSDNTFTVDTYTGSYNVTPGTTQQQLATADKYMTGNVTVAGDANLVAANIKSGVTIFGVSGTLQESSGTSDSTTGTCQAEYYKCASVSTDVQVVDGKTLTVSNAIWMDTYNGTYTLQDENATGKDRVWQRSDKQHQLRYLTDISRWSFVYILDTTWADYRCYADTDNPWDNLTYISGQTQEEQVLSIQPSVTTSPGNMWSGYKAVFDSTAGTWSFESNVTEGLTYTSVTPVVGGIYSADALVTVSMLYDGTVTLPGCVFYAELKDNTTELKSGQTLTIPQSAVFQTLEGVQCVQLNGTDQITFTPQKLPSGNVPRTYCFWNYITSTPPGGTFFGSKPSSYGSGMYYQIEYYNSGYNWSFGGNVPFSNATAPLNQWNFVAVTYNGNGVYYLYVNKTKYNPSNSNTLNTKLDVNYIGPQAGYYAKARIFDYCLSESEIGTMVDNGL